MAETGGVPMVPSAPPSGPPGGGGGGGPRFRISVGRGLGEDRSSSSQPQQPQQLSAPPLSSSTQQQRPLVQVKTEPGAAAAGGLQAGRVASPQDFGSGGASVDDRMRAPGVIPRQAMNVQHPSPLAAQLRTASPQPGTSGQPPPQMLPPLGASQMGPPPQRGPLMPGPGVPGGPPGGGPPLPQQAAPGQEEPGMVMKCVRFFTTLIQLSQQPDQQQGGRATAVRVRDLVTAVIFDNMQVEEFTRRLQEALRSQAQPHLLPFLQKTLPFLRQALQNGEVSIDGITSPGRPAQQQQQQQMQPRMMMPGPSSGPPPGFSMNVKQETRDDHVGGFGGRPGGPGPSSMPPPPVPHHPQPNAMPQPQQEPPSAPASAPAPAPTESVVRVLREGVLEGSIVNGEEIMRKITRRMNETCYVEEDVLTLVAEATESRLREMLANLCVHAEHRLEPLRMNPNYMQVDDTRRQLRFLEDIDKSAEERRSNQEKAELIRMSKNKSLAKDIQEKAKQMQRADAEAARNRDANAAAIAALSSSTSTTAGGGGALGNRKRPWDSGAGSSTAGGLNSHTMRPRTNRVTLRDLHAVAATDPLCRKLVKKLAYLNPPSESL